MQQNTRASVSLVLGGVRSGKSRYAQPCAEHHRSVVFVATDSAGVDEMRSRIKRHRADRPAYWRTIQEPLDLAFAISGIALPADVILVDCLTLFAATLLESCVGGDLDKRVDDLCHVLSAPPCTIILVSKEVGCGVVTPYPLGRRYRDLLGEISQRVAYVADEVILMFAGPPLWIKSPPPVARLIQ